MPHYKQFHANLDLFADPYLNVNKQFLSSLATCPNQHLAGCDSNASTPPQVAKTSSDVFHTQPPARSIPLAKQPVQENYNGGYLKIENQEFDIRGVLRSHTIRSNYRCGNTSEPYENCYCMSKGPVGDDQDSLIPTKGTCVSKKELEDWWGMGKNSNECSEWRLNKDTKNRECVKYKPIPIPTWCELNNTSHTN